MPREDDNIYDSKQREEQMEEDEISPGEAGFVEGYEKLKVVKCKECGNELDLEHSFELEDQENDYLFCSEACATKFQEKLEKIE